MDQKKIGSFLRKLRKEKELTQSQLAEYFNVSDRTVSRWETGSNMPDLALLVELADFYDVDIKEIICGERKSEKMEKEEKETLQLVADYAENEKKYLLKRVRILNFIGIITMLLACLINILEINVGSDFWDCIMGCLFGFSLGVQIMNLLYTTGYLGKIRENPKRCRIIKMSGVICLCIVLISIILSLVIEHL